MVLGLRIAAFVLLGTVAVILIGARDVPPTPSPAPPTSPRLTSRIPFQGGVCWVGRADREGLAYLHEQGTRWISVTPFAYGHAEAHRPPEGGYRASTFRGESLGGIREVIEVAHGLGLKVLVKPHIWFSTADAWRGDIAMRTEEDWAAWFRMYEEFLDPFVALCAELEVAGLCIGCELGGTVGREKEWRAIIARVRAKYDGALTYAANWNREVDALGFWDALDWIGVQAYYPLTTSEAPTEEQLRAGWEPWKEKLEALSAARGRPIVLTEVGYRPEVDNGREPWKWQIEGAFDAEAQARAYRALFSALDGEEWVGGIHVWKWFAGTKGGERPGRRRHDGFSPQGLPAERVIFEEFRKRLAE